MPRDVLSLAPVLVVAVMGILAVGLTSGHDGRRGTAGTVTGAVTLVAAAGLSIGLPAGPPGPPGTLGSTLDPMFATGGDYLRLAAFLWALDGLLLVALARVTVPAPGLAATVLAGVAIAVISLAAAEPVIAALAASATGLASLALTAFGPGRATEAAVFAAARELRATIVGGSLVVLPVVLAPAVAAATLGPSAPSVGGSAAVAGVLAVTLVAGVAVAGGVVPFHLRVPRLVDAAPPAGLSMLLAWAPVPLSVVALGALDRLILPAGLPFATERLILVSVALLGIGAAALGAWLNGDLRHVVGYVVIGELGVVVLGLAVLDAAAWGPTRAWLLVLATSKAALGAWALAVEARFDARRTEELRGWARRAPLLGVALGVTTLATLGLPGWVSWTARADLAAIAGPGTPATLAWLATWLTTPVYIRLLVGGLARPLSRVNDAPGERPWLPSPGPAREPGGMSGSRAPRESASAAIGADRLRAARARGGLVLARNRAPLASALVLATALLAGLVAAGPAGVADAAPQPQPEVARPVAG